MLCEISYRFDPSVNRLSHMEAEPIENIQIIFYGTRIAKHYGISVIFVLFIHYRFRKRLFAQDYNHFGK